MSALSNGISSFVRSLRAGPGTHFTIIDDILSLVIFSGFFGTLLSEVPVAPTHLIIEPLFTPVIQYQVFCRLHRQIANTKSSCTSIEFRGTHTVLAAGYFTCAVLAVSSFSMKMILIGQHTISWTTNGCPAYWRRLDVLRDVCIETKWLRFLEFITLVDNILGVLFQFVIMLADGLMVSMQGFSQLKDALLLSGTAAHERYNNCIHV
jgi:hypothetical protein